VRPPAERPDDTTIVRHAEEATVGRRVVERGSARMRKVVDERPVSVPVEVEVERLEVVHQSIRRTVRNADAVAWEEQSIELTLHAQEATLRKRTVARERVAVERRVDTEAATVVDELRVEQVEVDRDVTVDDRTTG
jgi:hypothetical protein